MALMLDQQENENVYKTNNDFLVAQLYERQQKEAAKYELSKSIYFKFNKKNF